MASTAVPSPSDLPPELLGRIFEHHVQNCVEAYERASPNVSLTACDRFSAPYAWLRATHVCAYWRAVALAHPLLWSHIVITSSSDCITTFLSRSCGVPLTVRSSHTSSSIPLRSLRLVLAELHRIRSLELISKWWTWDDVAAALAKPAPLLRSLSLSTPSGLFDEWFILPVVRLDSAPIEELVLRAYGFPWENPAPYASLRRLRIEKGIPAKPTVDRVVRALQSMRRITSLELHDVFYPSSRDPQGRPLPAETAQMDELRNLELAGDCVACGALLSALEFPPDACIALDFSSGTRPEDVATALTPLRARFPPESDESRTVLIEESAKSYVLHLSFGTADHLDVALAKATARFTVTLRKDAAVFRAACDTLDAGSARALWLCGVQDCAALLSAVPNVAHLRISGHSYAQAATLLTHGLTQDASEPVIHLEEGALRTVKTLVLADVARAEGKEDLGNLKRAIRRRRRSSGSLSNVVFARCAGVCADDFKDLGADVEVRVCA